MMGVLIGMALVGCGGLLVECWHRQRERMDAQRAWCDSMDALARLTPVEEAAGLDRIIAAIRDMEPTIDLRDGER